MMHQNCSSTFHTMYLAFSFGKRKLLQKYLCPRGRNAPCWSLATREFFYNSESYYVPRFALQAVKWTLFMWPPKLHLFHGLIKLSINIAHIVFLFLSPSSKGGKTNTKKKKSVIDMDTKILSLSTTCCSRESRPIF